MGIFFKKYIAEFEVDLTDGTSGKGKINVGGTILSDLSEVQSEVRKMISKNYGANVERFTKYKIYEV
jgi:hypothetical protein